MIESVVRKQNAIKIAIWLIIIAAAVLRFYNLGEMSLSNDELSSLTRVKYDTFSEMISKGIYIDVHPAGFQAFLFYWVKIFGDSVFAVRFPFVISSLISIWLIYQLGKKWYNDLTALLSASAFSFLTMTLLFSQLTRMYSLGIMFSLFTVYFWTDILFLSGIKNRNLSWFGWVFSMSAALHLHYFSFIFVGLVGLSGIFFVKRNEALKYFMGGMISLLLFIPEIPVFISQMKVSDNGDWLGPPSKKYFFEFIFELFNQSYLICLFIGLVFLSGILFGRRMPGMNKWRILSLLWFFISFGIAYLYSVYRDPILKFATLLFVIPFLLLFIFSYVPEPLLKLRNSLITVLFFSILLIYDTVVHGEYFSKKHFGVFREIADDAECWAKKYGVNNVPLVINVINPEYLNYYFNKMKVPPFVITDRVESPLQFSKLFNITDTSSSPYFAYIWSSSIHPMEVPEIIRYNYPFLIEKKEYFNSASYLFGKRTEKSMVKTLLFSTWCNFEKSNWPLDLYNITTEKYFSESHSQKMNAEYSTTFSKKILEIPRNGYRYISFSAQVFTTEETSGAQIAISFSRNNKPYDYHGYFLSDFKLKAGQWQPVIISAELPKEIKPEDVFLIYFWNPSKKLFYIDDLKVEIHSGVDPYVGFIR